MVQVINKVIDLLVALEDENYTGSLKVVYDNGEIVEIYKEETMDLTRN